MKPPFNKALTEKTKGTPVREPEQRDLNPKSTVVVVEVGGGDASVLLVRGLSCSFLLGLRSGGGAGSGERKQDLPNSDAPNHGSISDLARGQRALMIPPSPGPQTGP